MNCRSRIGTCLIRPVLIPKTSGFQLLSSASLLALRILQREGWHSMGWLIFSSWKQVLEGGKRMNRLNFQPRVCCDPSYPHVCALGSCLLEIPSPISSEFMGNPFRPQQLIAAQESPLPCPALFALMTLIFFLQST